MIMLMMLTMTHRSSFFVMFMLLLWICQLQAAAIICGNNDSADAKNTDESPAVDNSSVANESALPKPSEVNQFLHNVQCTLEKAKPWIEDLEKEAKRLEETAKRVGLRIIHRFGDLMDTLLGAAHKRPATGESSVTTASPQTTIIESGVSTPAQMETEAEAEAEADAPILTQKRKEPVTEGQTEFLANDADNEISNVIASADLK